MELENLRQQEPGSNDPFQGNRWFRIAVIALSALAVLGVLIFLLIFLGFCAPNRQTTANPTPKPPATAVVVVVTETAAVAASPTAAPATATLVLAPTSTQVVNAQPTTAAATATQAAAQPTSAPATPTNIVAPQTRAALATRTTDAAERPGPLGRLYVGALHYDPPNPVRNEPVNFSVTVLNLTGQEQNYPLCIEIFLPDKEKPLGTTDCNVVTVPTGASQVPVGFWIGTGIKQCIQLRARAVMKEQGGEARVPLTTQRGEELWTDFGVCP